MQLAALSFLFFCCFLLKDNHIIQLAGLWAA